MKWGRMGRVLKILTETKKLRLLPDKHTTLSYNTKSMEIVYLNELWPKKFLKLKTVNKIFVNEKKSSSFWSLL